jgi:glycosyltransferase involved in cell wall biosynthesis
MDAPLFSVIIPTYNRSALLREALNSVFAQTFTNYEVVVVDDGSTDDTEVMVQSHPGKIQFLRQQNLGPGAARNAGVAAAGGTYIAFLDSDDLWFPWTLATYQRAISAFNTPDFICGDCVKFRDTDDLRPVPNAEPVCEVFADYYAASSQNIWIGTCGAAIRREAFLRCGGYLNGHINAEDSDLWMRLGTARGFVHISAPLVFGYRVTPASASQSGTKTISGVKQMVLSERLGLYPGGTSRQRERWQILTRHIRPASLGCRGQSNCRDAWWFYRQSFWWHISLMHFKYLVAMPLLCFFGMLNCLLPRHRE